LFIQQTIFVNFSVHHGIGRYLTDRGYFRGGDAKYWLDILQKDLALRRRNKYTLSFNLWALIILTLEMGDRERAKEYLAQLEEMSEIEDRPRIYQLATALLLKTSPQMRDKVRAQDIFERIANDASNFPGYITYSLLHLCDLLIFEYKSTEDMELFARIKSISQRLYDTGKTNNDPKTIIKALLLMSKLSLLDGDLKRVEQLLGEAHEIADQAGVINLMNQILQEKSQIKTELEKWDSLLARNAPIRERIEQAHLEEYVQEALRFIEDEKLQP
jgi:hypothetical protein